MQIVSNDDEHISDESFASGVKEYCSNPDPSIKNETEVEDENPLSKTDLYIT